MNARFSLAGALAGLVFVALGALFFLDAVDLIELQLDLLLPVAVIVLGVALVLSALRPRGADSG